MGFFDSIKSFVSDSVGSLAKSVGVGDLFGGNPLGGMLSAFTGGGDGSRGLGGLGSLLGGLGDFGKMLNVFMGVAEKFMGDDGNLLSEGGLGALKGIASQAKDSGDVAKLAKKVGDVRRRAKADVNANEVAKYNLAQLFAKSQAQVAANTYNV